MRSRCPFFIYPSERIMIGVMEMIVIMTMEARMSKHIVDNDNNDINRLLFRSMVQLRLSCVSIRIL